MFIQGNYESLTCLAQKIEDLEKVKKDFIVPNSEMHMDNDGELIFSNNSFNINETAHAQLASKLDIPKKYYDKMVTISGLRTRNVNAWLEQRNDKNLIRTLDGTARAFLSDRYKPLDHILILSAFLPVISDMQVDIKASSLTESKMYLQIVFPKIQGDVVPGDTIQSGLIITNSETGQGAVDVESIIWRLLCKNGMIGQSLLHKYHVGRRIGDDIEDYNIFRDDTIQAEIESFRLRIRDILSHALSETAFQNQLIKMKKAAGIEVENPKHAVEEVTKKYLFSDHESDMILNNFFEEKKNVWGLANSITTLAHNIENQERQYYVETVGNDIIQHATEWADVA